jgi:hypothetical protein
MMRLITAMTLGLWLPLVCAIANAAAPANAPAGTTGLCNDGTFYSGPTKQGACKGHKGVKDWYGTPAAAAATAPAATPPAATPAPATAPATAATPAPAAPHVTAPAARSTPQAATAAGGGAGKVWVNKGTKVYHCPGDKWYGKTKEGEYLSEADAKAQGFKPDHNKACK